MKNDTTNIGQSLTLNFKKNTYTLTTMQDVEELTARNSQSRSLALKLLDCLEKADYPLVSDYPETVVRITWGKATRYCPSIPRITMVTIADWDFSKQFAITDRGERVKRTTLYRLPKNEGQFHPSGDMK